MIEYLEKLAADREYQAALSYAEQLLSAGEHSVKEMVAIQCVVQAGRIGIGDYSGAVIAGEIAVQLAKESEEWDYFGLACMDLGAAWYYLQDWDQALHAWLQFLMALTFYQSSAQYEARVQYNIGLIQTARGDYAAGCRSMEQAVSAAERLGAQQHAHGIRVALIGALLKAGQMHRIPRLLAQCARYIRYHRDTADVRHAEMWHMKMRIEYTTVTGRIIKARRLALRGLSASEARSDHQFAFHMTLAQLGLQRHSEREAVAHFLAARSHAIHCRRQDLEAEAGEAISKLMVRGPALRQMADLYYLGDSGLLITEDLDSHM